MKNSTANDCEVYQKPLIKRKAPMRLSHEESIWGQADGSPLFLRAGALSAAQASGTAREWGRSLLWGLRP